MRQDVLATQNAVYAKQGNDANSACKVHLLASSSTGISASSMLPGRPLVLGLPAASFLTENNDDMYEDNGSELKKRKCVLALQSGEPLAADGDIGNNLIGTNVSHGGMLK